MPDRPIKLKKLRKILSRYGVAEDSSLGKGSHTTFYKMLGKGMVTYVVPTARKDVLICYVRVPKAIRIAGRRRRDG